MNDLKKHGISLYKNCDIINEEINQLRKKELSVRQDISKIKKQIESENMHLVGKFARCSNLHDPTFKNVVCKCTGVMCNNDFDVFPLFHSNGKKAHVDYYEWIEK